MVGRPFPVSDRNRSGKNSGCFCRNLLCLGGRKVRMLIRQTHRATARRKGTMKKISILKSASRMSFAFFIVCIGLFLLIGSWAVWAASGDVDLSFNAGAFVHPTDSPSVRAIA